MRMRMRPDTAYPTCEFWQASVPTTGLMHSDQRQPGAKVNRPMVKPSSRTTSIRVFSGVRVSSGASCDLASNVLTATGVLMRASSLVQILALGAGPRWVAAAIAGHTTIAGRDAGCIVGFTDIPRVGSRRVGKSRRLSHDSLVARLRAAPAWGSGCTNRGPLAPRTRIADNSPAVRVSTASISEPVRAGPLSATHTGRKTRSSVHRSLAATMRCRRTAGLIAEGRSMAEFDARFAPVRDLLDRMVAREGVPGAALAVAVDGEMVFEHYAGVAAPGCPAHAGTLWDVASIGK